MNGDQLKRNEISGIQNFNDGLFKNMTFFVDAVWEIDVETMTVWTLYDRIHPEWNGSKISMDLMHENLDRLGHSDVVEKIHSYYTKEFLSDLKDDFYYENQFLIDNNFHILQSVITPHFDEDGKVVKAFVTTRDVNRVGNIKNIEDSYTNILYHNMVDVLNSAKMGLWSIVIGDGESKFYPDHITAELVGCDENMDPEEIFKFWQERVDPEYVEETQEAMKKMVAGIPSEVIYLYQHPTLGKITVRCGGLIEKKYSGKGIKISGYHQDISDFNEKLLKQVELSNALLAKFHSVLSIDIPKARGKILWDPDRIFYKGDHTHFDFYEDFFEKYFKAESYRANRKNLDIKSLGKTLSGKKLLSMEMEGATLGWFRITIVPSCIGDDGSVVRCVFLAENIDDEKQNDFMRAELLHDAVEKEKREKETLKAVASSCQTMYLIDFRQNNFFEIVTVSHVHEYATAHNNEDLQEIMWGVINLSISDRHREQAFEFTDFSTLAKRLDGRSDISCELINSRNQWVSFSFVRVDNEKDSLGRVVFISKIIDDVKKKEEHLVTISTTDPLTELHNRYAFEKHISSFDGKEVPGDVWFVCIDVNGLKATNDTKGHAAGDELIVGVAECIRSCISTYGKAYRIGGDEFSLILRGTEKEIRHVMFSLENKRLMWKGNYSESLSFSRGVVCASEFPGCKVTDLEREADRRMYEEKRKFYGTETSK